MQNEKENTELAELPYNHKKGLDEHLTQILRERKQGLSYGKIAKLHNCSRQAVFQLFDRHQIKIQRLDNYIDTKGDYIESKALTVLDAITPEKVGKLSAYQAAGSFGILNQQVVAERNRVADNSGVQIKINVNITAILQQREQVTQRIAELEEELGGISGLQVIDVVPVEQRPENWESDIIERLQNG